MTVSKMLHRIIKTGIIFIQLKTHVNSELSFKF